MGCKTLFEKSQQRKKMPHYKSFKFHKTNFSATFIILFKLSVGTQTNYRYEEVPLEISFLLGKSLKYNNFEIDESSPH